MNGWLEASAADPRSREAFVRAAEILGRHAELRGDRSAAAQLYRRILELDGNGIVARRLLLMLWRQARFREAAELAPRVVPSDANLAQHLRGSDAVNDLARRLGREARREATTQEVRMLKISDYRMGEQLGRSTISSRLFAETHPVDKP